MSISFSPMPSAAAHSGLRAAQLRLDTSAHNVANVMTPDFKRQGVTPTAQPGLGGVMTEITQLAPGNGMDRLADDMVQQRVSLYSFKANLQTVQTQDEMLGSLLDMRA
jgi:flagellar hook-associated protein FlgK